MPQWKTFIIQSAESVLDFFLRKKSFPAILVKVGLTIIISGVGLGAMSADLVWLGGGQFFKLSVDTGGGGNAEFLTKLIVIFGAILLCIGALFGMRDHLIQQRQMRKKRIIVIEHRGLHQSVDAPLSMAIPKELEGQVDEITIDNRQSTATSLISNPEDALYQISGLRNQIRQKKSAAGSGNISLLYGGISPVPLTFLAGVMIGDEGAVLVMDWDRFREKWRQLDGEDDADRFQVTFVDNVENGTSDVAIAVSVSYASDITGIRSTIKDMPLVRLSVSNPSPSGHWSGVKQACLTEELMNILNCLMEKGVERVHLFIAAPNSVVFNFGRHYDERLHPIALVYQYEKTATPPFPWSVQMPNHGMEARLVRPT